ncbi:MAG: hypothetical protein KDD00_12540 [Ignavibacteriae bacterium]|nr:hypothetical protein [Ignavibacteriota bacterium]
MKSLTFFLFISLVISFGHINSYAGVDTEYTFSSSAGTYSELTGGTVIAVATHTSQDPGNLNNVTYGPIALPFSFKYKNNELYTSYFISTNGFITFGATAPGISNYCPVSSSESYTGAVSAFGLDLIGVFGTTIDFSGVTYVLSDVRNFNGVVIGAHITAATGIPADTYITAFDTGAGTITLSKPTTDIIVNDLVVQIASGSIKVKTEGTSPNRIHTIQFKNFRQYLIIGKDDNFNFQIKLFESDGTIKVIYGNMDKSPLIEPSVFGQVGLRGSVNTDWNNRTNTGNWAISSAGLSNASTSHLSNTLLPAPGQTYIWGPSSTSYSIKVIPQGFHNNSTLKLNMKDTVTSYLRNAASPYMIVDSAKGVIDSVTFEGTFVFNNVSSGNYYLVVKHRNSIETWSSNPVSLFRGSPLGYNFTNAVAKAYGNNLINVNPSPVRFGIFSGDINQDGFIDLTDVTIISNDANDFLTGYIVSDVNGDGFADLSDLTIAFNNAINFVSVARP